MIEVPMSKIDFEIAFHVGTQRALSARRNGTKDQYGIEQGRLEADINGAIGEAAFAKYLNVFYHGTIGETEAIDVACFQTRTTAWPNGHLLIYQKDNPKHLFVLMRHLMPKIFIVGWVERAGDFMNDQHLFTKRRPGSVCWEVQHEELRPAEEILPRFRRWQSARWARAMEKEGDVKI